MRDNRGKATVPVLIAIVVTAAVTVGVLALLLNILERKAERANRYADLVPVTEDDTDPAKWGVNWPLQYDQYLRTAESTRTRFGGHGGSEAMPAQKFERDPWLQRMFDGYAFAIDYRDRRGHAYMLYDQEETERLTKPQSGSCLHCHASIMPVYRELGDGDAIAGFRETYQWPYDRLNEKLHEMGHDHPVSCVDCHDPETMEVRVTRPGFLLGIRALAESDSAVPHLPSIERWRDGPRDEPYDPNVHATRNEMRAYACGQCHVEYYCGSAFELTFPWARGLKVEDIEATWDAMEMPDGGRFYDFVHAESGAEVLKAQHPEFELWSQGIHARSGVTCADCHMPYMRIGATKVSDHWVRSPLLNVNRACQSCHHFSEEEILARVDAIQQRNFELLQRAGDALMAQLDAIERARTEGASDAQLAESLELQRKAQWRLDYIAAENSMGFHAPQEAARILGEAADYARQGQTAAIDWRSAQSR